MYLSWVILFEFLFFLLASRRDGKRDGKRERERKSTKSKSYVLLLPCRISHEQLYVLLFLTLEPGAAKRDPLNAATRKKLHELDIFKVSVLVFGLLKGSDNKHLHFTWMGGDTL